MVIIEATGLVRYLLGLFFVGVICIPESSKAMDIVDVYEKALLSDSEYRESVQTYFSTREAKPQGVSGLLPRVEFRASIDQVYQEKEIDSQSSTSEVDFTQKDYDIRLSQPLFDAGKFALYNKGERKALQAELELESARQDLRLRVVQAFFEALYAEDTLSTYVAQKKATFEFLDQAKKSFKVGTVTVSDVYDAQSRYELVSAKVMQAEVDLELKRKALWVLAGEPINRIYPFRESIKLNPPAPSEIQGWLDQASTSNLDVQIQTYAVDIASAELDYNKAGHYPKLEFTASLDLNDQSATMSSFSDEGPGQSTNDTYVGLLATVPLFEGGYVMSKVREAKYAMVASQEKLDFVRKDSVEFARESFINTTVGAKKMEVLQAAVSASKDALRASRLGYGVGVRSAVDVLNAQEQLSQALREQSKNVYDTLGYSLKLKAAAGALRDEDLMQLRAYTQYAD